MEVLDALQDIRSRNARNERVANAGGADLATKLAREEVVMEEDLKKKMEDEEDEKLVREVFSRMNDSKPGPSRSPPMEGSTKDEETSTPPPASTAPTVTVKRKADGTEPELHKLLSDNAKSLLSSKSAGPVVKKQKVGLTISLGIKIVRKGKAPMKAGS
jgi:hypothetical protein